MYILKKLNLLYNSSINQLLSDGFRDMDTVNANVLAVGKTKATKVEIGKVGATTEVLGDLNVKNSGKLIYNTVVGTETRDACLHIICNENEGPLIVLHLVTHPKGVQTR